MAIEVSVVVCEKSTSRNFNARVIQEPLRLRLLRFSVLIAGVSLVAAPMRSQTQTSEWQGEVRKYAEAQDWTSAMSIVDRQAAAAPIAGKAAAALAEGFIGRAVAESRHAFRAALRQDWLFRSALLVGLSTVCPSVRARGDYHHHSAASLGVLSHEFFLQFLIFGYTFATVISIGSVRREEITYKRYNDWQDVARLVSNSFFEHFPCRQMHMVWRLQGLWQYFRGDFAWKPLKRKGIQSSPVP